jgi:hypothetical protein
MVELAGHCMCGAVTWRFSGEVARNLVCHCADCQRATSAPFTAFLGLRPDQLVWSGEIVHYESSAGTFRGFCPACGTRLYFRSSKWPTEIHVHAATLTDPSSYQPTAQVVLRSRAKWLDGLAAIPAHQGFQAMPAEAGST